MSTKTLRKRIALVAVSALGFGLLSVTPSNAAAVAIGATAGVSADTSSITLIAASAPADTEYGVFELSLTNSSGVPAPLQTGESLTATVIANPQPNRVGTSALAATTNADLKMAWTTAEYTPSTRRTTVAAGSAASSVVRAAVASPVEGTDFLSMDEAPYRRGGVTTASTAPVFNDDATTSTATYGLRVATSAANALDSGFYTIRVRVLNAGGNTLSSTDVKFQVVSSRATSGAVLTATATGSQLTNGTQTLSTAGVALALTTRQNLSVKLADANGGRVVELLNQSPTISVTLRDKGTAAGAFVTNDITVGDAGAVYAAGATEVVQVAGDGTYHAATSNAIQGLAGTGTLTARFGDASATASVVLTTTSGTSFGNTTISATGQTATATGNNWNVPLTTKSATATFTLYSAADATATGTTRVGATDVYYTVNHAGCVLGDMTPARQLTPIKAVTDASGQVKIDIANANPINGCVTTVEFSGAGVVTTPATGSLSRIINWVSPTPTSFVKSPAGDYVAALASSHKVTWTVLDQFGAAVVGSTVQFRHSGANKPASTTSAASAVTDANGQVSYSWTDSKGVVDSTTLGFDVVSISQVGITTFTATTGAPVRVDYVTTLPAIASLYATYTSTASAASTTVLTGVVPATNIGGTTGIAVSAADQIDTTKVITATNGGDKAKAPWVTLNFQARKAAATTGTAGVPTTVTVTGAKLIGNDGKLASSVIVYANEDVYVLGTTTGVATVTATNGTLTSTATINFVNAVGDARVLKLAEASGLVTASVTDAFGNAVAGVNVDAVGSGGAWLGNGSTSATFKTATDGTVTFSVTGSGTITASLAVADYAKASNLANAGNSTGSVVTTGAPAGVRSASVATSGNNATADSAQAAADAAAEATDAANAATDAANAAAEAADAATAAAQDAADAVAALSTQVTELVSALRKQITSLTNLVIKIQKKVRA